METEAVGRTEPQAPAVTKGRFSAGWNLVAAGPSRAYLREAHLLPDSPVVTVNRALDIVGQGIKVDFAAFADGPSSVWTSHNLERFWTPETQLWVSLRPGSQKVKPEGFDEEVDVPGPPLLRIWDRALPASVGLRVLPWGEVQDWKDPEVMRCAFTTLCAFRRILDFNPKEIRILCMDMAGPWVDGWTEEACHENDMKKGLDRWQHERATMERQINQARAAGVRVEVVTLDPALRSGSLVPVA